MTLIVMIEADFKSVLIMSISLISVLSITFITFMQHYLLGEVKSGF